MNEHPLPAERGVSNRVVFKCELAAARTATRILRAFLAEQGLDEAELFQCEVCLAEACNNAVQHADPAAQAPVTAEAIVLGAGIELRVTDHTEGFELRERPEAIDPSRESGRGLFIIQSLMDDVRYYRGAGRNTLVMRKTRTRQHHSAHESVVTLEDAKRQLASCQQTISGMARELCVRSETLAAIFRCSAELGRSNDLEGFCQRLLTDLLHLTAADWFVLRLVPAGETRLAVMAASEPGLRRPPLPLTPDPNAAVPLELASALSRRSTEFEAGGIRSPDDPLYALGGDAAGLVQPLLSGERLVGTLAIGRRAPVAFSPLETEMVRTFTEFVTVQVTNARHAEEQCHARIVEHELELAHRMQRALLPRQLPQLPGFSLAASWESARQVGGDFYDVIPLEGDTLLLVVADVMGKGVPAAMFATILRSLLRALVGRTRRPAQLLKRLNELLYDELSSVGMFITVQLVVVDPAERQITAASAGHCPVMIASRERIESVRVAGIPLGILPNPTYREQTVALPSPASLLLYTDGVTEAQNPDGELFGQDRLATWLSHAFATGPDAPALRAALAAELAAFQRGEPLRDDQAFLVLAEDVFASREEPSATRTTGDFTERPLGSVVREFFPPALLSPISP